jgi:hypothetical protein
MDGVWNLRQLQASVRAELAINTVEALQEELKFDSNELAKMDPRGPQGEARRPPCSRPWRPRRLYEGRYIVHPLV